MDDGAVGNGVFTGGKRWESGGITVFFTDCQRRRAAVGTSYAKLQPRRRTASQVALS